MITEKRSAKVVKFPNMQIFLSDFKQPSVLRFTAVSANGFFILPLRQENV
jgi:hypothetical protein